MPQLTPWAKETLDNGLRGHVRTVLLEADYICKDFRSVYSHFYSKKFVPRDPICARLHFFGTPELTIEKVTAGDHEAKQSYIGFSVLQPTINPQRSRGIGRTVIDPLKCGNDPARFFCLQTPFSAHIQGVRYEVNGYPWMSQSGEATVCAHAALWGVCRYLSERYNEYGEYYPYDLIEQTGFAEGRRVPYRAMRYTDYSNILSSFGCHPVIIKSKTYGNPNWMDEKVSLLNIYSYVESGFPVLTSFNGHVAAVIGHTSRQDLSFDSPYEFGFHDSYALVDQYVVVDDNYFPFQLLGDRADGGDRNYGTRFASQLAPHPSKQDMFAVVVPLPEKAFMPPDLARRIGATYFNNHRGSLVGFAPQSGYNQDPLVTRLFLTSSNAFKKRKSQSASGNLGKDPDLLSQFPLRLNLPHFIWVMEISPLSLYTGRSIIGEVVLDASADRAEVGFVYGRIGNLISFQGKESVADGTPTSFCQFTHNLGER